MYGARLEEEKTVTSEKERAKRKRMSHSGLELNSFRVCLVQYFENSLEIQSPLRKIWSVLQPYPKGFVMKVSLWED